MSYISAIADGNEIKIIERDKDNKRRIVKDNLEFIFYVIDEHGEYKTIFGERCSEYCFNKRSEFHSAKAKFPAHKVYEHDANPVFRYLSKNYNFEETPTIHTAYYDIEVAYKPETKYSNPDRADNEVIAISIYQDWTDKMYILTLSPETLTLEQAEQYCQEVNNEYNDCDYDVELWLYDDEGDLLKSFLFLIEDSDVISGWNSKMYDFKYLTNRIPKIIGPTHLSKLCLLGKEPIEKRKFNNKFKREEVYYDCIGRVHLDYMELYKKYTYTELSSYSLDHVSYVELGEQKVEYEGSLDHLFKYDFKNFIRYSIKDTYLIKRLDDQKKYIDLTNLMAHNNGVLMETTMGTVAITEQAILNQGHYFSDEVYIFPPKTESDESESGAAGAFVSPPHTGIRELVAGNDINSLYPSTIRALNMSPETLVAQVDTTETDEYIIEQVNSGNVESAREAWGDLFNTFEFDHIKEKSDKVLKLTFNRTDEVMEVPAHKIYDLVYNSDKYCISANGTIFTREKNGIIPALLARWYGERKQMQAKAEYWEEQASHLQDGSEKDKAERNYKFWDQRQLAKKIVLNALYGSLLNKFFRFYDKRLGQSTTLTGRSITRHMSSKINELIEGEYNYLGNSIIYGDSISGDSIIDTDQGRYSIEELFNNGNKFWSGPKFIEDQYKKEYTDSDIKVLSYDHTTCKAYYGGIYYIYRHRCEKSKWILRYKDTYVEVTGDHSIMIMNNSCLYKKRPVDIDPKKDSIVVYENNQLLFVNDYTLERSGYYHDEYVYDIGMENPDNNWFFANDILVKNTDSSYFSLYESYMKSEDEEKKEFAKKLAQDRGLSIEIYDKISNATNETFSEFMDERFNTGIDNGSIIKAGRENIASYSLFIKKKRYAMNLFDKDGIRQDTNGKDGKLKIMGIEIKRSDTPKIVQDVLQEGLDMLLKGQDEKKVLDFFVTFKKDFLTKEPWMLGRPSGANAVDYYTEINNEVQSGQRKKTMIPNAIAGAIAWNELLDFFEEDHYPKITNGSKVIVCPLKTNDFGYDKIAYPTDQTIFPDWFKELPFDLESMADKVYYQKVENIFGILGWNFGYLKANNNFHDNFVEDDD